MKRKNLRITWGVLFVGLKRNWLTPNEVAKIVHKYSVELSCKEDLLVEFIVNKDNRGIILDLLRERGEPEEEQAIKYWQQSVLLDIERSRKSIKEKLRDIESQWSRFDYPEEWRDFIYYMPNDRTNSDEKVSNPNERIYQIFLDYLNHVSN